MKEKNDFKRKGELTNGVARPRMCLHCHHEELEIVELTGNTSRIFIKRLVARSFLSRLFPKLHHVYGYRCMNCGYLMFFTSRDLK